jgi:enoyl-CoA hydratase/carnithine racemase
VKKARRCSEALRKRIVRLVLLFHWGGDKAFIAGADIAELAGASSISQRDVMMGRSCSPRSTVFRSGNRDDQWVLSWWWL